MNEPRRPGRTARRCRAPGRPERPNSADSSRRGRPNSFTRVAPGAENRSVIWVLMAALCVGRLALEQPRQASDPPRREHEHRQQHHRQQRDRPREAQHHAEGQHQRDARW